MVTVSNGMLSIFGERDEKTNSDRSAEVRSYVVDGDPRRQDIATV